MISLSDDTNVGRLILLMLLTLHPDTNINNVYFDNMASQIYPSDFQLNIANTSDTEAAFLDLHLSISNYIFSTKIYDKRDDFDFKLSIPIFRW